MWLLDTLKYLFETVFRTFPVSAKTGLVSSEILMIHPLFL